MAEYDLTPNYLNQLIAERDEVMSKFLGQAQKYRAYQQNANNVELKSLGKTIFIPGNVILKLQQLIARIKVLNNRIARLGEKYSIVKVKGTYWNQGSKVVVLKSFELYYTEISEYDATCKARNHYKDKLHDVKTIVIPTGKDVSNNFFK